MSEPVENTNNEGNESVLDSFAPDIDIQAELDKETNTEEKVEKQESVEEPEKKEPEQKRREDKFVPIQALDEARHKEREARARAEQIEKESTERFAKLEERLARLANPPPEIPTYYENPAEFLRLNQEQFQTEARQRFEIQDKQTEEYNKVVEKQQFEYQVENLVTSSEEEYSKSNPDYLEAVDFLKGISDKNLFDSGITDPKERSQIIRQQIIDMSVNAMKQGKNPAEMAHKFAKNYGFQAKPNAGKQIESIAKGQNAVSMGNGGKSNTTLNLKSIEAMSDEEVDALLDDKQWRKMLKG